MRTGVLLCLAAEVWPALDLREAEPAREAATCFAQAVYGSDLDAPWLTQARDRARQRLAQMQASREQDGLPPEEIEVELRDEATRMREEYARRIGDAWVGEIDSVERTLRGGGCLPRLPWFDWLRDATRDWSAGCATQIVGGDPPR